ncbi:MAG: 23S rRNA (adenine(2503)-C(2))-methyltransferase RlmN [Oscillospiraceae bacterium]|nr:23S rRNA (adenine(2503)-C(2))-methyltransferase RlmN [Oscillospiraceae bacterium]
MIDILSLNLQETEQAIIPLGLEKYRAKQIYTWLHDRRCRNFADMTNISTAMRTKLSENFCIKSLKIYKKLESKIDNTVKYLFELEDTQYIETVLMEYDHGNSLCVSTQVGCKMGCDFCASTKAGFIRNLTPAEILLQIYETEYDSNKKISNVVLMGIGEPLDNYDNTIKFLELCGISMRNVSLSTCGLIPQIYKLAEEKLPLTLSISLHSAIQQKREKIMPVAKKYPLKELIECCKKYIETTHRRITFEYTCIDGFNISRDDADALIKLLRGINCHINLIPVNTIKEANYNVSQINIEKFKTFLQERNFNVTIRRRLGADINAACGQLKREVEKNK